MKTVFKYQLFTLITLLSWMGGPTTRAEIREAPSMRLADAALHPDTFLVLDIDNTLLRPAQTLGSDQWFNYRVAQAQKNGADLPTALQAALGPWLRVQLATRMLPVESQTPRWLAILQAMHVRIIGLTARPLSLSQRTEEQLASVGMSLARGVPAGDLPVTGGQYHRGILYVGPGGDKGQVLLDYLHRIDFVPHSLLFVDDRLANVQSVERAFAQTSIPHLELRYGAADAWVAAFNPVVAEEEWAIFDRTGRLVTDDQVPSR